MRVGNRDLYEYYLTTVSIFSAYLEDLDRLTPPQSFNEQDQAG